MDFVDNGHDKEEAKSKVSFTCSFFSLSTFFLIFLVNLSLAKSLEGI